MLAGSPGLLGSSSDIDSDKSHIVDGLDGVPEDTWGISLLYYSEPRC